MSLNREEIDLRYVEQLADAEQLTCLGYILSGNHFVYMQLASIPSSVLSYLYFQPPIADERLI